jgi:hypothetical protein
MTLKAEGILSNGRELALLNLLNANDLDVGSITETEIPSSGHEDYNVKRCNSFLPLSHSELLKTVKYRVVVVVRSALVTVAKIRLDLMHWAVQSIWIQVELGAEISAYSSQQQQQQQQQQPPAKGKVTRFLICGINREWSDLARESTALSRVRKSIKAAPKKKEPFATNKMFLNAFSSGFIARRLLTAFQIVYVRSA